MKRHRLAVRLATPYVLPKRGLSTPICELSAVEASRALLGDVNSNYQRVRLGAFGQATPTFTGALFATTRVLRRETTPVELRSAVQDLQVLLGALYNRPDIVIGNFGPATEGFVRDFQQKSGLVVDGTVGPNMRTALKSTIAQAQKGLAFSPWNQGAVTRLSAVLPAGSSTQPSPPPPPPGVKPPTPGAKPPTPPSTAPSPEPSKPLPLGWIFGGLTAAGLLMVGVVAVTRSR